MDTLQTRLKLCKERQIKNPNEVNCFGTALYLTCEIDEECFIHPWKVYEEYLANLQTLRAPIAGCLIAWRDNYPKLIRLEDEKEEKSRLHVTHLGVVSRINPLLITHRDGTNKPIFENVPFCSVDASFRWQKYGLPMPFDEFGGFLPAERIQLYLPKGLRQ